MDENKIMGFITSDYSWEQVIYEIIAWEGLNPWDLDLIKLADGFVKYMNKIEEMDFRLPAKYILVASMLLKMKSDYLRQFKEQLTGQNEQQIQEELMLTEQDTEANFEINPLEMPPRRNPTRKIVVDDLVFALKKVMTSHTRKISRKKQLIEKIDTKGEDINKRVGLLYSKINTILSRIRKKEVEFSEIVENWERGEIVDNFVPLIHLDTQDKVKARQEEIFKEIWIRKGEKK